MSTIEDVDNLCACPYSIRDYLPLDSAKEMLQQKISCCSNIIGDKLKLGHNHNYF